MALASDPSAWRGFRKPRVAARAIGRPRKHPALNMFYGYPAERIAEWCAVALSTAYAYKCGSLKPSKPAAKPFSATPGPDGADARVARLVRDAERDRGPGWQ